MNVRNFLQIFNFSRFGSLSKSTSPSKTSQPLDLKTFVDQASSSKNKFVTRSLENIRAADQEIQKILRRLNKSQGSHLLFQFIEIPGFGLAPQSSQGLSEGVRNESQFEDIGNLISNLSIKVANFLGIIASLKPSSHYFTFKDKGQRDYQLSFDKGLGLGKEAVSMNLSTEYNPNDSESLTERVAKAIEAWSIPKTELRTVKQTTTIESKLQTVRPDRGLTAENAKAHPNVIFQVMDKPVVGTNNDITKISTNYQVNRVEGGSFAKHDDHVALTLGQRFTGNAMDQALDISIQSGSELSPLMRNSNLKTVVITHPSGRFSDQARAYATGHAGNSLDSAKVCLAKELARPQRTAKAAA